MGIKPAFISRVSNAGALAKARHEAASQILRKRRFIFSGRILRAPSDHPLRACCFVPGTFFPLNDYYVRKAGRPNKEWMKTMIPDICAVFGTIEHASELAANKAQWNSAVTQKLGF